MSLLAELKERYGLKLIHPYGNVIPIPKANFQNNWEETLKEVGAKVFQSFNGELFFFVREPQVQPIVSVEQFVFRRQKNSHHQRLYQTWTDDELGSLKELFFQGRRPSEIASKLGRSIVSVKGKIAYLKSKTILNERLSFS